MQHREYQQYSQLARAQIAGRVWAITPERLRAMAACDDLYAAAAAAPEAIITRHASPLPNGAGAQIRDGVAIIQIKGVIFPESNIMMRIFGGTSLQVFADQLAAALASDDVDQILLEIDSPGGVVTGVSEAARMIRDAASQKRVTAWSNGAIASAAYWLASAADEIVMTDTAMAGSIGVVTAGEYQVNPDVFGYRQVEITSSNADAKRPDLSTESGQAILRDRLDAIEALFIGAVAEYRGTTPEAVIAGFGNGRVFVAGDAIAHGMADRISDLEPLLDELAGNAGASGTITAGQNPFIHHAKEEISSMTTKDKAPAAAAETHGTENMTADALQRAYPDAANALYESGFTAGTEQMASAAEEARKAERTRIAAIYGHADGMEGMDDLVAEMIGDGTTADAAAAKLLAAAKAKGGEIVSAMRQADADLPKLGTSASASGDPESDDDADPAADDFSDEAITARWDKLSAAEQADFGSFKSYAAGLKYSAAGRVRIKGA